MEDCQQKKRTIKEEPGANDEIRKIFCSSEYHLTKLYKFFALAKVRIQSISFQGFLRKSHSEIRRICRFSMIGKKKTSMFSVKRGQR